MPTVRSRLGWVERWGRRAWPGEPALGPQGGGSPRIAVLGNCQASAIARAIRCLLPTAEVRFLSVGTLGRTRRSPERFAHDLSAYDAVFGQRIPAGHIGLSHYEALSRRVAFQAVPAFVFAAFHPDLVYVGPRSGTRPSSFISGPAGHYQSALLLYGYLAGFSAEQTLRLFTRETFAHLGYLHLWDFAAETLLTLGREAGMDLAPDLLRWTRRGCFMHSVNHPKMFVAADLARILLRGAGIPFADYDLDGFLVDDLSLKGLWPVYEPVGRHYGLAGSYVFQTPAWGRARREGRTYGLSEFAAASFATYASLPRAVLSCDRVESWFANPDLGAVLRERAGL